MNEIIQNIEGELRVSSEIIAERTKNQHASVLRIIRDNLSDFEAFGTVGFEIRPLPGGGKPIQVAHLNEPQATLLMTFMRNSEVVKAFKVELVRQFFEMRQALNAPAQREVSRRELAQMIIDAEDRAELEAKRADRAEATVKAVEAAEGITLREFHKHYFSDIKEREFFELLYKRGYLIDQRNTRINPKTGEKKNGKQHMHPSYKGKAWLYLHGSVDSEGYRRENTRVRPGSPEVAFAQHLAGIGLPLNSNSVKHVMKEIAA